MAWETLPTLAGATFEAVFLFSTGFIPSLALLPGAGCDEASAERHYRELEALLATTLV